MARHVVPTHWKSGMIEVGLVGPGIGGELRLVRGHDRIGEMGDVFLRRRRGGRPASGR